MLRRRAVEALEAAAATLGGADARAAAALHARLVEGLVAGSVARFAEARGNPEARWERDVEALPVTTLWRGVDLRTAPVESLGVVYEALLATHLAVGAKGGWTVVEGERRRRQGSHFTPRGLVERVVTEALAPLRMRPYEALRWTRIADLSMGSGAFLLETFRQWKALLVEAGDPDDEAARWVATVCLHGVDLDPVATELARMSLALEAGVSRACFALTLRCGDGLADRRHGFDAVVGNPPWVSYVGRAAQPLAVRVRARYEKGFAAFAGYRNLQGLFVERATRVVRPGGRVGLVLPSSMAELQGYAPTRAAHDARAVCDEGLPDLGEDAFDEVFQPSMVLLSTVRSKRVKGAVGAPWPIERRDLDEGARQLLGRLRGGVFPATLFGDCGLHTEPGDLVHCRPVADEVHCVAVRVGADVGAAARRSVTLFASEAHFGKRLRPAVFWKRVAVLVRQTARWPIAAKSDGGAFRNSLLAVYESEQYGAGFWVAYLNASLVRWRHYLVHRDARNGMPQVKVAHLRSIPAPSTEVVAWLTEQGERWGARNTGLREDEQAALDAVVFDAFGVSEAERARVLGDLARW